MYGRLTKGFISVIAITVVALGVATSAAVAAPIGEYAAFKECPLSVPNIESCIYSETTSGEVVIGSTATPISAPIVFQGGETRENIIKEIEVKGKIRKESEEVRKFVPAANGETLVKTPEPVPGGLAGLIKCNEITNLIGKALCQLVFENGLTGVNATTELVGEANFSFDALASGETGLIMPVRLHLENPLLGSECYVGSAGDPIMFELTTGITSPPAPNEPITGSSGAVEVRNGGSLVIAHEDSAVDNSFAVPDASGCGGSLLSVIIDPIIDAKLGLPSEAGNNAAILNGTLEAGSVEAVEASE